VKHDVLEDRMINAQEATDLIKILRALEGKTLDIFRY
jgi:hypothetical protein